MINHGDLTDAQYARLQPLLPPERSGKRGCPYKSHRNVINGILWVLRTGAPWRDLPERYPSRGTCSDRLYRWQRSGLWERLLQELLADADGAGELDWNHCAVDSTVVRAHQHAAGARRRAGKKGAQRQLLKKPSGVAAAG
jgi:transposase